MADSNSNHDVYRTDARRSLYDTLTQQQWADVRARWSLSQRQVQVLRRLIAERTVEAIASELGICPSTVRKHIENVRTKLGVHTRAGLVARILSVIRSPLSGSAELRIVDSAHFHKLNGMGPEEGQPNLAERKRRAARAVSNSDFV